MYVPPSLSVFYLQYDEGELYEQFCMFYDDVLPEFRKAGNVVQFKVCLFSFINGYVAGFTYRCHATMNLTLEGMSTCNTPRWFLLVCYQVVC